ncbi:hypothetical protein BS47DRAFT_1369112 [Hydnum rufescens UP504]|uniref:Uncharacterized protein n=1 Tax=Hydnum rufescens UP504 TaxID=1448309 RepID=A0A9P6AE49_9AGAM|nr:hypothetical protein BS47DRAFT_1369112 [Hydnum rufescens UP504]
MIIHLSHLALGLSLLLLDDMHVIFETASHLCNTSKDIVQDFHQILNASSRFRALSGGIGHSLYVRHQFLVVERKTQEDVGVFGGVKDWVGLFTGGSAHSNGRTSVMAFDEAIIVDSPKQRTYVLGWAAICSGLTRMLTPTIWRCQHDPAGGGIRGACVATLVLPNWEGPIASAENNQTLRERYAFISTITLPHNVLLSVFSIPPRHMPSNTPICGLVRVGFSNQLEANPSPLHQSPRHNALTQRRNAIMDRTALTGNPIIHISEPPVSHIHDTIPAIVGASDPHRSNPRIQNVVFQGFNRQCTTIQSIRILSVVQEPIINKPTGRC